MGRDRLLVSADRSPSEVALSLLLSRIVDRPLLPGEIVLVRVKLDTAPRKNRRTDPRGGVETFQRVYEVSTETNPVAPSRIPECGP